jgi:hypothetical protein
VAKKDQHAESEPEDAAPETPDAPETPETPGIGPTVPPDGEPPEFEAHGSTTGVQPVEPDEIPEAGR